MRHPTPASFAPMFPSKGYDPLRTLDAGMKMR
jgi:hypothetical protein